MTLERNDDNQEMVILVPFNQHSKRKQFAVIFLFFAGYLFLFFILETWLSQRWQKTNEFAYKEFYSKPFHYKLDPFSFIETKNGVPIDETEPPNPYFIFSFEESLLTRFLDYYIWRQSGTKEADVTTNPDRLPQTMISFGAHLRNRIYYRIEKNELEINPILLSNPVLQRSQDRSLKREETIETNKLLWNVIPYCTDPDLEEAIHELGNIHGFLFVKGNHQNYRFLTEPDSKVISNMISNVPVSLVYLHHHSFLNVSRHNLKSPVQVSLICDPIERKVRQFYIQRHKHKEWSGDFPISDVTTGWWKMNLEQCMASNSSLECQYNGVRDIKKKTSFDVGRIWFPRLVDWILPKFCDYDKCNSLGRKEDLEYVKSVIQKDYSVVGTLENLDSTMDMLENKLPQFFRGLKNIYKQKVKPRAQEGKVPNAFSINVPTPSPEIKLEMEKRYALEIELYRFVSERLNIGSNKNS